MKIIFISGPSGSGKTTLSNKVLEKIKNSIVLRTDNYYKTGLISKLLSKLVKGYFDRSISFNYKLFKKDLNFILENRFAIHERFYNFEKKIIKNSLKEKNNINFLIIEGIFAKNLSNTLYKKDYFFLELKINKNECMKRVLKRDFIERGKSKIQAKKDFLNSWDIYYSKYNNKYIKTKKNVLTITKNTNIEHLIKKLCN